MTKDAAQVEHQDIVIIGAGISGIGLACYLREAFPAKNIVILEGRDEIGGTWSLFQYPGIRSDSDLHTFAYEFKPWRDEKAIADGPMIRQYLAETAREYDIESMIRFERRVVAADWSSDAAQWLLTVQNSTGDSESTETIRASWVVSATGYYRYDRGYTPEFAGREDFTGDILHPQHWPKDYDYAGKRVVVIGSGATAITLIPAMATGPDAAAHVTMLQRTPTYIVSLPGVDSVATLLTKLFGEQRGYRFTRVKNVWQDHLMVKFLRRFPEASRKLIRWDVKRQLPAGFDVDKHFNPPYAPWDQRLCVAPDGDLFTAISEGSASVVTDRIERFTPRGVLLESGEELDADVIVTATGLEMKFLAGLDLRVDGEQVTLSDTVLYRGAMPSNVPNWTMAFGYTKSSWTLRIKLIGEYLVNLLRHMDQHGYDTTVAVAPPGLDRLPLLELTSGYMQRTMSQHPAQGDVAPWRVIAVHHEDTKATTSVDDHVNLEFSARIERELATERAQGVGGKR